MRFPSRTAIAAFVKNTTRLMTLMTLIVSVAGYLAGAHRILELLCHFRMQYLAVAVLFCVVLFVFRDWRWGFSGLLCVALNAGPVVPWYFGRPAEQQAPDGKSLRVLLANVYVRNLNSAAVVELVHREAPDVVVLQEVDDRWANQLLVLDSLLPHTNPIPRDANVGIKIWSRLRLHAVRQIDFDEGC